MNFVGLENTLRIFYFGYLTDGKSSWKKSERLIPGKLGGVGGMEKLPM